MSRGRKRVTRVTRFRICSIVRRRDLRRIECNSDRVIVGVYRSRYLARRHRVLPGIERDDRRSSARTIF